MMNRSLWVVVTAVAMWHAPAGAQEPIAPSQVQASQPSKSIKVPIESDNRHLAFTVWGDHGPSIIIEGGGGHASSATGEWDKVAKALSENNRVYLYDRAGLGDSGSPSKLPRTSADIAADLHQAIDAANIPTPVVLVGFSLGGMHSLSKASCGNCSGGFVARGSGRDLVPCAASRIIDGSRAGQASSFDAT